MEYSQDAFEYTEHNEEWNVNVELPKGWTKATKKLTDLDKLFIEKYAKSLCEAERSNIEYIKLSWDPNFGLTYIEVYPGDTCSLAILSDDLTDELNDGLDSTVIFIDHNIDDTEHAAALYSTALKYRSILESKL